MNTVNTLDDRKQELMRRASEAARGRDMTGFLNACHRAEISAYAYLAELQRADGLQPQDRANLATIAREMDCYRGKHGRLPHEQAPDRPGRSWFRRR
ncbi:MAG TPA: hypothetical protein VGL20_21030 [Candidatus Dormibacteraeota bacterium]